MGPASHRRAGMAQPTDLYLFGFDYVPVDHPANPRDGPLPPVPGGPVLPGGGGPIPGQ